MTHQKLTSCLLVLSTLSLIHTPWGSVGVIASAGLLAFLVWIDRVTMMDQDDLLLEITQLKDRLSAIEISRGMGR